MTIKTTYFVVYDSRFVGIECQDYQEARTVLEEVREDYPGALIQLPKKLGDKNGWIAKPYIPPC